MLRSGCNCKCVSNYLGLNEASIIALRSMLCFGEVIFIGDALSIGFFFFKTESLIFDTNFNAVKLCRSVEVKGLTTQQRIIFPESVGDNIWVSVECSSSFREQPLFKAIESELKEFVTNFLIVSPILLLLCITWSLALSSTKSTIFCCAVVILTIRCDCFRTSSASLFNMCSA